MKANAAYLYSKPTPREFQLWVDRTHPDHPFAMKHKGTLHIVEPTEAEIQHAAYMLWIENGRPEGRDFEHWQAARELLCHRQGRDCETRHRVIEIAKPAQVDRG